MTPGVQESRQEHNKNEPKYQLVEDEYDILRPWPNLLAKFENNRDLKAMSNLLAKWAVKYSKFSKTGTVDLDGPLHSSFTCSHKGMCSFLDIAQS